MCVCVCMHTHVRSRACMYVCILSRLGGNVAGLLVVVYFLLKCNIRTENCTNPKYIPQ